MASQREGKSSLCEDDWLKLTERGPKNVKKCVEWTCRLAYVFFDPSSKKIQRGSASETSEAQAQSGNIDKLAKIYVNLRRSTYPWTPTSCHVRRKYQRRSIRAALSRYHLFKRTKASKVRPKWPSIFAEVFEPQCIDSTYPLAAAQTRMLRACCQLRLIALSGLAGSNVWNPNCRD